MAGLYLHIPFCKKRCVYCDFYSTTLEEWKDAYVQALCQELDERRAYLRDEPVETVYLGGGTPSQLTPRQLEQIFEQVHRSYSVTSEAEITLEANPDDLTDEYVRALRSLPVNRLSMGVQTFDNRKLARLNRRHDARQAIEAVMRCQQAGFNNISIDLIYGLPQETITDWQRDLQQALALPVKHISAYHLMYEEGTPLWKQWQAQQVTPVEETDSVAFFETLTQTLRMARFEHYEISNFCRPGYESRHNTSYWQGIPYLGCGASAHSYDGSSRRWNVASLKDYIHGLQTAQTYFEHEVLDTDTRYNEYVMTGLRTARGISLQHLEQSFGADRLHYALQQATPHLQQGLLLRQGDTLKLSHQGIFISDGIMSDLMFVD